jgi:hypothetical protein
MTLNTEGTPWKSPIRTGEAELVRFFAQKRACDDRDREIALLRRQNIGAGSEECAADGAAAVANACLVVGKVRTALN